MSCPVIPCSYLRTALDASIAATIYEIRSHHIQNTSVMTCAACVRHKAHIHVTAAARSLVRAALHWGTCDQGPVIKDLLKRLCDCSNFCSSKNVMPHQSECYCSSSNIWTPVSGNRSSIKMGLFLAVWLSLISKQQPTCFSSREHIIDVLAH